MAIEEAALAAALKDRLELVADRDFFNRDPGGHLAALQRVSERIVELQRQLPQPVDPQLRHFLERCSYGKALDLLEANLYSR